ncbi:hypothetical protein Pmar_PMAR002146 [Perkinsus marinus ATCC 50983]|uniref:Uncharacterized protein n=1 Tax=Perkinsus marinus (strain ATCC 50983 / TXsc) TaxID=423536 RepID=C5KP90_PERM5|nr:hypothetical protein Pmar_PMAR002146 [Perkinsus marinus ATCC 50983]EER13697.1 hypothetical protein Pmar_PMAR002146 [Perkinsus marinus ATCC 50983]|eukprot:XP_002781902.1 hypothetical protein Pmar_PMAR002146 [Perkinsus marinus ATCC 50983]
MRNNRAGWASVGKPLGRDLADHVSLITPSIFFPMKLSGYEVGAPWIGSLWGGMRTTKSYIPFEVISLTPVYQFVFTHKYYVKANTEAFRSSGAEQINKPYGLSAVFGRVAEEG